MEGTPEDIFTKEEAIEQGSSSSTEKSIQFIKQFNAAFNTNSIVNKQISEKLASQIYQAMIIRRLHLI